MDLPNNLKPEELFMTQPGFTGRGSLIFFRYSYVKPGHDPQPLVLVTDVWPNYIRGVNINYLTMPVIKQLISGYCGNQSFSYAHIKGNNYIKSAFRQYKRMGVVGLKTLNNELLKNTLQNVRKAVLSPNESEAIRNSVREQLQKSTNPSAQEFVGTEEKFK